MKQKSKIGKGNARGDTFRTTVPKKIAEILDVELGDYIDWNLNHVDGQLVITITKSEEKIVDNK